MNRNVDWDRYPSDGRIGRVHMGHETHIRKLNNQECPEKMNTA